MILLLTQLVIEPRIRGLCRLPYHGHPKGCPNFDHKAGCPPTCPTLPDKFDLSKPVFAIVNEFNLAAHIERMRLRNPGWSDHQLVCCLYWQPSARKELQAEIRMFLWEHPGYAADTCPEAGGMNVTETLKIAGIELEWPPRKTARQVAIAAVPPEGNS